MADMSTDPAQPGKRSRARAGAHETLGPLGNPLVRVAGADAPLSSVVAAARAALAAIDTHAEASLAAGREPLLYDYAQIDLTLHFQLPLAGIDHPPAPGLGYAGFASDQRGAFRRWILDPAAPAPPAFRQLYLANLEVRLLEGSEWRDRARAELIRLAATPAWTAEPALARTVILAAWLAQDGAALAQWLATADLPPGLWGAALGCQALLGQPLLPAQLGPLLRVRRLDSEQLPAPALALRLDSLATSLGMDPLAFALTQLSATARGAQPWHCQHRELRLAFPQPNVADTLTPLLAELVAQAELPAPNAAAPPPEDAAADSADTPPDHAAKRAHLIIEFGQSRSEFFDWAMRVAQKQTGFIQLMDENRHVIYRVPFRRNEVRRFWQLWECVQGWSSTRVYCDGRELEKWQVYPYSQYLR